MDCSCCPQDEDVTTASLPDTAIIYRLYTECGRLINLHDMNEAFGAILTQKQKVSSQEIM